MKEDNFWKIGFFVLFIVTLVFVGYYAYSYGKNQNSEEEKVSTTQATPTVTVPQEEEEEMIKEAIYEKMESDETKLSITINSIEGDYAKGGIKELDTEVGGGYFLAAKKNGNWIIVHDGQASPFCTDLEDYNFPLVMVSECLNSQGAPVQINE